MTEPIWNSGPPPHVGWWRATYEDIPDGTGWRWFKGERWSGVVFEVDRPREMERCLEINIPIQQIKWNDYWPEDGQVPRINPQTGEVTGAIRKR